MLTTCLPEGLLMEGRGEGVLGPGSNTNISLPKRA